jgi:hypothetical protein
MEVFCSEIDYFFPQQIEENRKEAAQKSRRKSRGPRVQEADPEPDEVSTLFFRKDYPTYTLLKFNLQHILLHLLEAFSLRKGIP